MNDSEFPAPQSGFAVTHFLVVADQDRSRGFYQSVFGATVVMERDPVILKMANSWLILGPVRGEREQRLGRLDSGPHVQAPVNLDAVAGDSASDVWITGQYFDTATSADEPFTAHWNGTAWSSVPVPVNGAELFGLTVISPGDAWAVGNNLNGTAFTENWNGSSWQVVPNPAQGLLLSVTATGAGNVTAAGHNTTANGPTAAIIISWNGSSWVNDTVPVVGATEELFSASAAPGGTITWALGSSTSSVGAVSSMLLRNG